MTDIDPQDKLAVLDYLDGRMTDEQAIAFEIRLADDAPLAEAVSAFAMMDHLQRAANTTNPGRQSRILRRITSLHLASAASLLVVLGLGLSWLTDRDTLTVEARVAESGESLQANNVLLGLARETMPETWLRGGSPDSLPDAEYWDLAAPRQRSRLEEVFTKPSAPVAAGRFIIPFRPSDDCSVIVICVDDKGVIHPPLGSGPIVWVPDPNRLEGDVICSLPDDNIKPVVDDLALSIVYEPGFLLPISVPRLHVRLGVRSAPVGRVLADDLASMLQALSDDQRAAGSQASTVLDKVDTLLRDHGFLVLDLVVVEPP